MSAPAILLASLAGSAHCAAMCGGLVSATARSRTAWSAYQVGRLLSYLALGAIAGALGERALGSSQRTLAWVAVIVLSFAFAWAAVSLWRGRSLHVSVLPQAWVARAFRQARGSAFGTGLLSALLPCGWLHVFVLGAVSARDATIGALMLLVFWMGTLPALAAAPWVVDRVLKPVSRRSPRLAAVILLLVAVGSVGDKVYALVTRDSHTGHAAPSRHCH